MLEHVTDCFGRAGLFTIASNIILICVKPGSIVDEANITLKNFALSTGNINRKIKIGSQIQRVFADYFF